MAAAGQRLHEIAQHLAYILIASHSIHETLVSVQLKKLLL